MEPRLKAPDFALLVDLIADTILKVKAKYGDPLIFVGGRLEQKRCESSFC